MLAEDRSETVLNKVRAIIQRAHQAAREAERHPDWLRKCHKISDIDFLLAIFVRASICVNSGLHFLQKFKQIFGHDIACSSWFDANSSDRRARMVMAVMPFVNKILQDELLSQEVNHLGDFAVLNDFDCVAYDGHFMKRASQIKNAPGSKNKANAGYIFGIDLKTGILEPITVVSDGSKKQSEIPYFKEFCNDQELSSRLRKKRITVYDRAMASAGFLADEQGKEHYIITRSKKNSTWNKVESLDWDKDDPANINIIKDLRVMKKIKGKFKQFRIVVYRDVERNKTYRFLTSLGTDISPGLIAELYRRRWQVEKSFDNTKNDLGEQQAWGISAASMKIHMCAIACAYNFMRCFHELNLAANKDKVHKAQIKQEKRIDKLRAALAESGQKLNPLRLAGNLRRLSSATIRSVQSAISMNSTLNTLFKWLLGEMQPRTSP